ncbi:MAG: hypothetical protein MUE46_11325 [Xanthomonadales bacterium]|jgi:hypothetical protein|nr:hypothetical protein [Xanthomonadales bacterium]
MSGLPGYLTLYPDDRALRRALSDTATLTELAREPMTASMDPDWRLALLEFEVAAVLPAAPASTRHLLLLYGESVALSGDSRSPEPLDVTIYARGARWQGDAGIPLTLGAADTRVLLQLTARSDRHRVWAALRPVVGSMVLFHEPGCEWLIQVINGAVQLRDARTLLELESGNVLRVDFSHASAPARVVLDGGGELAMFKLTRAG